MKILTLAATLGLTALLAACDQKAETNGTTAANTSSDMGNMAMPEDTRAEMAKGNGTVTAVDKAAGTITIDHGPIPAANWPAMIMAFEAKPEILGSVKVGDKVDFDLALKDGAGEVTAIQKQ